MNKSWPTLWRDLPLAIFDTETTGKDVQNDRIIEIGIVLYDHGQVTKTLDWMVNPEIPLPPESTRITGIKPEDVEHERPFRDIAKDVLAAFEGRGIVAYNIGFDRPITTRHLQEAGLDWPCQNPTIDPLVFAMHFWPSQTSNLSDVYERLFHETFEAHRACNDAEATGRVLYRMFEQFEVPDDLESLLIVQSQWQIQNNNERFWMRGSRADGLNTVNTNRRDLSAAYIYGAETDPLKALYMTVPNIH